MTEREWLDLRWPKLLLAHVREASPRKHRLFAVACCRRLQDRVATLGATFAIDLAERFADDTVSEAELAEAHQSVTRIALDGRCTISGFPLGIGAALEQLVRTSHFLSAHCAAGCAQDRLLVISDAMTGSDERNRLAYTAEREEEVHQAELVRDIFGNPFRPVAFAPEWRTDTALTLARQMYESRDFSAMPILADALQDAGCNEPAILDHCRDTALMHVRGCWVTDLVLGKA
jgi:hypothetical protein